VSGVEDARPATHPLPAGHRVVPVGRLAQDLVVEPEHRVTAQHHVFEFSISIRYAQGNHNPSIRHDADFNLAIL